MNPLTQRSFVLLATALVAIALGSPGALAVDPAVHVSASGLVGLANAFSEPPRAIVAVGGSTESCGQDGHCSFTTCAQPECEPGVPSACACEATTYSCTEDHSIWPGGEDTHALFSCECQCGVVPPGPEECTVENPLGDGCLVEAGSGKAARIGLP